MDLERQRTFRAKAELDQRGDKDHTRWTLRVPQIWDRESTGTIYLRPYYVEGWIAAVRAEEWQHCPLYVELNSLVSLLNDEIEARAKRDVRRSVGTAVLTTKLSSGKVTIPSQIVWLLSDGNPDRDLTIIDLDAYVEIWPTILWRSRMRSGTKADERTLRALSE